MAALTVQDVLITGLEATFENCAAGGDTFANDGNTIIEIVNGDASDHTVTIASQHPDPPAGTAQQNQAVVVTAGERRHIGPFNQRGFNDASGLVNLSYDAVTSLTIAVLKIPR